MTRLDIPAGENARTFPLALTGPIGEAARAYSQAVYQLGKLPLREFEAARIRIAQIDGCLLCLAFRTARDHDTRGAGEDEIPEGFFDEIESWRTSTLLTRREAMAVEYADRFATEPQALALDENFWDRMRSLFADDEIAELTISFGAWIALGRFTHVLGVDVGCDLPSPLPEPRKASNGTS